MKIATGWYTWYIHRLPECPDVTEYQYMYTLLYTVILHKVGAVAYTNYQSTYFIHIEIPK